MKTTRNDSMLACPLCGFEFLKTDTRCQHGCPLGKLCKLVRCPSCHYEFPEETRAGGWFKRLFRRRSAPKPQTDMVSLIDLREGEQSELVCLHCSHASRRNSLAVYGLVPGSQLVLQQKRPSYVIRVGETELAIEPDIASEIFVRRVPR